MSEAVETEIRVHPKLMPLYKRNWRRFKVMHGGRAGLKSWACAQAIVVLGSSETIQVLCAREIQKSIRESVHQLISDTITRLGLLDEWEIQNDRIFHKYTGSKINFIGLRNNTHNLKSYEGTDICWVEEAQAVTEKSWKDLTPTIRKSGSEIWVTFNPDDELDPTYVRFITNPRQNSWVQKTSWRDAKEMGWFSAELEAEMLQMKEENYKDYLNIWEGEPISSYEDAIIEPEWILSATDAHLKLNWEPIGAKIAAFDPADTGADAKAFALRHGFLIQHVESWTKGDIEEAIRRSYMLAHDLGASRLVADADGLGAAMKIGIDRNEKEYGLQVDLFKGGSGVHEPEMPYPIPDPNKPPPAKITTNKDTFRNQRAQFYWFLRDRFQRTHLAVQKNQWVDPETCISISSEIPRETRLELKRELTRIRRKKGQNSSLITLESKDDMKKAGMKSPNLADALMMVFANDDLNVGQWNVNFQSEFGHGRRNRGIY